MAQKKDFSNINVSPVYSAITEATADTDSPAGAAASQPAKKPRKEYSEKEIEGFLMSMKTTGHKGAKLPRINLAFAPDVYDYIQTMSRVQGRTMTEFVNMALREHMDGHADIYEKAIEFRNSL